MHVWRLEGQETLSVLEGWRIADKVSMLSSWQLGGGGGTFVAFSRVS